MSNQEQEGYLQQIAARVACTNPNIALAYSVLTNLVPKDPDSETLETYYLELINIAEKYSNSSEAGNYLENQMNELFEAGAFSYLGVAIETDVIHCLIWLCPYIKNGETPLDFPRGKLSSVIQDSKYIEIFTNVRNQVLEHINSDVLNNSSWNILATYFNRFLINQFKDDI